MMLIQKLLLCSKCKCDFELKSIYLDGSPKLMLALECPNCGQAEIIVELLKKLYKEAMNEFYKGG